jgi:protein O-mannosyl-transferase
MYEDCDKASSCENVFNQIEVIAPPMKQEHNRLYVISICVVLVLATIIVCEPVLHNEFISFDDDLYIYNNNYVKAGLTRGGLVWAVTKIHAYNWHPLTWVSHMLDWQLFGSNPAGHHLTGLIFHIANTVLLFIVLRRMTRALWPSAFVAALFALHPLHVESVAWASERKDVLSTFFWILTMWAYVRYAERPNIARYLLIILAFCLGLMAKQMLVTLPFVLLLLDYWPLGRLGTKRRSFCGPAPAAVSVRRCILEKVPLLILSVIASATVYIVQHYAGTTQSFARYPLFYRIENAMVAYAVYIGKMLWPSNLAIFYPHQHQNLPTWQITGAVLLLACITTAVIYRIRQKPYLAVGWLWYLGTLVPVIGLVQVGLQAYADRYTYMPLTGLFIIIAWGVPDILARLHYRKAILFSSAVLLLLALGVMTRHKFGYWRDSITLYKHATAAVQNNWWAHNHLGIAYYNKGELDKASKHFTEALRIRPTYQSALCGTGAVLLAQGELDKAITYLGNALRLELYAPGEEVYHAQAHTYFGIALAKKGRLDEAIKHYLEALRITPNLPITHRNLGDLFAQQGRFDEAAREYQKFLQITPDDPSVLNALGIALGQQGKLDEAIAYFTRAVTIEPASADVHINLGNALVLKGRLDEAVTHFEEVLKLEPNLANVRRSLGDLFAQQGRFDEAVREYQKLLQITPNDPSVLNALGVVLGQQGKLDEAIRYFNAALLTNKNLPDVYGNLGLAYVRLGKNELAITNLVKGIELDPNSTDNLNNLAWVLATTEDTKLRNPTDAVKYAQRACELSGYEQPSLLDTLAVAYAAAGNFPEAVKTAEKAIKLAEDTNEKKLAEEIQKRLEFYKAGQPYHEK